MDVVSNGGGITEDLRDSLEEDNQNGAWETQGEQSTQLLWESLVGGGGSGVY